MKIAPPKAAPAPRQWALLVPGYRRMLTYSEQGMKEYVGTRAVEGALTILSDWVLYAPRSLSAFRYVTPAVSWSLSTWRSREVKMTHNATGAEITSLAGCLEGSTDPYGDVSTCLDWLDGYGVGPSSLSAMSWRLFEASLPKEQTIYFDGPTGRSALFGGRQEIAEPKNYKHMESWDIRAAYPDSMASGNYAASLREVSSLTHLDPATPGLARATVFVPRDLPFAPLPTRIAADLIQFQWGRVRGTWAWRELAAAQALGCEVKVDRVWAPSREVDLFSTWWMMAQTGRDLPGMAAQMAKNLANRTWGQFGMVGSDRTIVRWEDPAGNHPYEAPIGRGQLPHAATAHIAAETTARVRVRVLEEALYSDVSRPVHIDTDGVIFRKRSHRPKRVGKAFGEWSKRADMQRLELRAPQLYRSTCGPLCGVNHAQWHYVASGLTASQAPEFFRKNTASTKVSYLSAFDAVLPSCHSDDRALIGELVTQAGGFGRG